MSTIHELVEELRAMKTKLEHQAGSLNQEVLNLHAPGTHESIRSWIVELDDLIMKYTFEV